METLVFTDAQNYIYDFIANQAGNGIIDAVAGAGKTTTLMGCVDHISDLSDVVYCAFNASIRKEIRRKFHEAHKNIEVATIHSLGYKLLRTKRNYRLDDFKYKEIIKSQEFLKSLEPEMDVILRLHGYPEVKVLRTMEEQRNSLDWEDKNNLNEALQEVNRIKERLLDINQKYRCTLEQDNVERYDAMIKHFGIISKSEQLESSYCDVVKAYFIMHQKLLKEGNSIAESNGIIDYTDQLYLPSLWNLTAQKQYGFVFVDECQDLSRAQVGIVKKYLREDGRLLAVGDPYQAIYGFAGADCDSFQRVKDSFNCTLLKLTDCFRCPQDVIKRAQVLRKDIKGFKQESGKIYEIPYREVVVNIKEGDMVLCRTRLPLRDLALKLISKNFKVKIHPDELDEFLGDYSHYFTSQEQCTVLNDDTIEEFFKHVKERNRKRIAAEKQNVDPVLRKIEIREEVATMEETIDFLKRKYFDWHLNTLEYLLRQLKQMLSCPGEEAIRLSTIHRAKGLENSRVFILDYDKIQPIRELEWENTQELNLHYVALTRSKEELYLCWSQEYTERDEPDEEVQPALPINTDHEDVLADELEAAESQAYLDTLVTKVQDRSIGFTVKILPIQRIQRIPEKFYSFGQQEDTPFGVLNNTVWQKAKYWAVYNNLQDTEYAIENIICNSWRDDYYISTPNGIEVYYGDYNKSRQYTFRPHGNCVNAEQLIVYLNDESNYVINVEYNPTNDGFGIIHQVIESECRELSICNTNVYQESYTLVYCFKTPLSYAYIKLLYNKYKTITCIMPFSTLGEEDEMLVKLLESLKHIWQA